MRARDLLLALAFGSGPLLLLACGWDVTKPFERNAPAVDQAIAALDAGDGGAAASTLLEDYLSTGGCKEGTIGTPPLVRNRPNGAFDLGLSLFAVAEQFGGRFGDEERDAGADARQKRAAQLGCALAIVQAAAADSKEPIELRAHARYLEGNLHFLGTDYEAAVQAYDASLTLNPGQSDAGDPVARDAAYNRAIALRRIEDRKDAGPDAAPDGGDGGKDGGPPDGGGKDGGDDSGQDSGSDAGDGGNGGPEGGAPDGGKDGGDEGGAPPPPPDAGLEGGTPDAAPPPSTRDDRILDQLENAPTVQQEDAKKHAGRRVRGMADK